MRPCTLAAGPGPARHHARGERRLAGAGGAHASRPARLGDEEGEGRRDADAGAERGQDALLGWIEDDLPWPDPAGGPSVVRLDTTDPEPWPERQPEPDVARFEPRTGLRGGDRVRVWPYEGDLLETVRGTESDGDDEPVWVLLEGSSAVRSDKSAWPPTAVPSAASAPARASRTPWSGPARRASSTCAGWSAARRRPTASAAPSRPAPRPGSPRPTALGDDRLVDRARERRRWARRLLEAGPDDLYAALLAAFGRAFERWHAPAA